MSTELEDIALLLRQARAHQEEIAPREQIIRDLEQSAVSALKLLVIGRLGDILPPLPPNYGDTLDSELNNLCWGLIRRRSAWEKWKR